MFKLAIDEIGYKIKGLVEFEHAPGEMGTKNLQFPYITPPNGQKKIGALVRPVF